MHNDYDLKQEQLNKSSLMSSRKFLEGLMEIFTTHVVGNHIIIVKHLISY